MNQAETKQRLPLLVLGAIGVVFGDIGTSPLYALKETFAGTHLLSVVQPNILGILSLMFWTIMLLISLKYVIIVMRADNRGEGGALALLALVSHLTNGRPKTKWFITVLGVIAAALFYGDSMITPAISVLSAVEGLEAIAPHLSSLVIPITLVVVTLLFWMQRRGTHFIGIAFGPIMVLWFISIAGFGLMAIMRMPEVLYALDPSYAYSFIVADPMVAFLALGGVVLAVTGGEALYADMGHFGKMPIRLSWFGFVLPALVLNYFGQGALLLIDPTSISSPFFLLAPEWARLPMVILATAAAVIASQAVISGAFTVAHQSIQMGMLPRMPIIHTSGLIRGQVYVPITNWSLYIAVVYLVFNFQSASNLAAAYGIAVTGTMTITTMLIAYVMVLGWRWPLIKVVPLITLLLSVDLTFFAANLVKIPQGGWFPLGIAALSFTVLTTWRRGRQLLTEKVKLTSIPIEVIIDGTITTPRVMGTAVFMVSEMEGAPSSLMHNLKHNQVLHERNILLTIVVEDKPYVTRNNRVLVKELGHGFYRVKLFYGFMQTPDIPLALELCAEDHLPFDMMSTSFFISRAMIAIAKRTRMGRWRGKLFLAMSKNAMNAADFFKIPANRVIEMGTRIEI